MAIHQISGRWKLGLFLAFMTGFQWAILPIFLKIALRELDVFTITWFRFVVAPLLLGFYLRRRLPKFSVLSPNGRVLFLTATLFLAANYALYLFGLHLTSPTNAQVIIQLGPLFMGFGGLIIFKERYNLVQWVGLVVLVFGLYLFFHDQWHGLFQFRSDYLLGSFLVLCAAIVWAIYGLAQKQLLVELSSSHILLMMYAVSFFLFLPFAHPLKLFSISPLTWLMLFLCGLNTVIAYGMFAESLAHWNISRVSAVLAVNPLMTLGITWIASRWFPSFIPPEPISGVGVFGACCVVSGSMLTALAWRK